MLLSLWGKQMSESPSHRTWEEDKETLVPFMPYIVQNSMGKDLVWASVKLLITVVGPRQMFVSL